MSASSDIADIRKDYMLQSFSESDADQDPFVQFSKWWEDASSSNIVEFNAMTLCTCTNTGKPSARIVLLKGFDESGFTFFTNYESKKGKEISANPEVALVFFWKELERQVRIEGKAIKTSSVVSDAYFKRRPEKSKIGAWASPQSSIIPGRDFLEKEEAALLDKYTTGEIERPPHWGGFTIVPNLFEFWQGRASRLHDRLEYSIGVNASWVINRLAP